MKVLRAIGNFFVKIWKWIKNTAWVQPLLIVGVIFAVIFSIPPITSAIQAALEEDTYEFYDNYRVSLNGVKRKNGTSDVEKLTEAILNFREDGTRDENIIDKYGEKFFLTFYQDSCAGCETMKGAFETVAKEWGSNDLFTPDDGLEFKFHTVDCLQEVDDKSDLIENSAWKTYYNGTWGGTLFERAAEDATQRPYYVNAPATYQDELDAMISVETFETPTTLLIDFTAEVRTDVISEVFFVLTPEENDDENDRTRALLIMDAWNHTGKFAEDYHA